jgi:hypothetical protein
MFLLKGKFRHTQVIIAGLFDFCIRNYGKGRIDRFTASRGAKT